MMVKSKFRIIQSDWHKRCFGRKPPTPELAMACLAIQNLAHSGYMHVSGWMEIPPCGIGPLLGYTEKQWASVEALLVRMGELGIVDGHLIMFEFHNMQGAFGKAKEAQINNDLADAPESVASAIRLGHVSDTSRTRLDTSADNTYTDTNTNTDFAMSNDIVSGQPDDATSNGKGNAELAQSIKQVFDHWKALWPSGATLKEERVAKIKRALDEVGLQGALKSLDGWRLDDWPERHASLKAFDIKVLFRSAAKVEQGIDLADNPPMPKRNGKQNAFFVPKPVQYAPAKWTDEDERKYGTPKGGPT